MTTRRAIAFVAACAAAGIVTTIGIAALGAALTTQLPVWKPTRWGERLTNPTGANIPHPLDGRAPARTQYLEFRVFASSTVTFGMSRLRAFQNYTPAAPPQANPTPESVARRWERVSLLPWLDGHRPWPDPTKGESVWVKASGWPWRCLVCYPRAVNAANFGSHSWTARGGLIVGNNSFPGWADWPPMFPTSFHARRCGPSSWPTRPCTPSPGARCSWR